jgi:murein DD-endopeptidase MepM/ murein hydrolase activator NlpD
MTLLRRRQRPPPRPRTRMMARPQNETLPRVLVARPRHRREPSSPPRAAIMAIAAVAAVILAVVVGLPRLLAQAPVGTTPSQPASTGARAGASPDATGRPVDRPGGRASRAGAPSAPHAPASSPVRTAPASVTTPTPAATPDATPAPSRHPGAAPATAEEFDIEGQVIPITFPLKEGTRYQYRDNFLDSRVGEAFDYNHARLRRGNRLLRAHDGTDIYVPVGAPVVAPFEGVVIDPASRWQPWIPERYGKTAVIVSHDATSEGYTAILAHLDAVFVQPGQQVRAGEVIGLSGATGNAEGGRPHVHFELRAPFQLSWAQVGEDRSVDAFNPYPSLRAADPRAGD